MNRNRGVHQDCLIGYHWIALKQNQPTKAAHEVFFIYMVLSIIFHFLRSDVVRLREDQ